MSGRIHVLSLWRPWPATFFQSGLAHPKRIENRSKVPPKNVVGTWVAFHAGQKFDHDRLSLIVENAPEISSDPKDHPTGLVGMAFIAGYVTKVEDLDLYKPGITRTEKHGIQVINSRRWWLGPVAFLVPMVIPFAESIPCKGQQGWKFLSDDHAAMIREKHGHLMHITAAAHHGTLRVGPEFAATQASR